MLYAVVASLLLGLMMTVGDLAWAALQIRHRVANGVLHGAAMCLCIGLAIGWRARRPLPAAVAGPAIGVIGACTFYLLAPSLRWSALFPAWMILWVLFGVLHEALERSEGIAAGVGRGIAASLLSGGAFYLVSGMWTDEAHAPHAAVRWLYWSFPFLPGFAALFAARRTRGRG